MANIVAFMKRAATWDELSTRSVPLEDGIGTLVPVAAVHADDTRLIGLLARWRDENAFAFPTRFPVTTEGTSSWLRDGVLANERRLLFIVLDRHGWPVGHLGVVLDEHDPRKVEIDNVVRGDADAERGIMSAAMRALMAWATEFLRAEELSLRVLSDNAHAIEFYRRLDFAEQSRIPLRAHSDGDRTDLAPVDEGDAGAPDAEFVRMVHSPSADEDPAQMILTAGPSISALEIAYANDATRYGWNRRWSEYLDAFERAFADYVGAKYAIATSSCTGALHLLLLGLGIGPGDEVVVPDLTWVASANAVRYTGATPVFADVLEEGWCLDPASFDSVITSHTRAVMPVHLYGHPAQMDEICSIARAHGITVVEDAAPAIGAECNGRRVGSFGTAAAFSFQGAKLLVTGEGGMLVTSDDGLYERIRSLWDQGRDPNRAFWINELGWKYKLSNVQAAVGLAQLERATELVEMKRELFRWYEEELADVPSVDLSREPSWGRSIYWMTSVRLTADAAVSRDDLRRELAARNVDTRPVFPAISQYPIWDRPQEPRPVAKAISDDALNLPSGVRLRRSEVAYVCRCVREIVGAR